jgi:TonB family protein
MPWNAALWWQLRRLRLAIEIDCDHRVLLGSSEIRRYSTLLLEIGARSIAPRVSALAFARPKPFLERRIRVMTAPKNTNYVRTLGLALLSGLLVVASCQMDQVPEIASLVASDFQAIAAGPVFTPMTVRPEIKNLDEIEASLEQNYPPLLKEIGIGGRVVVLFYIGDTGSTLHVRIRESSGHDGLDAAALQVARVYEFTPALNREQPVNVWIQLPITFQIR